MNITKVTFFITCYRGTQYHVLYMNDLAEMSVNQTKVDDFVGQTSRKVGVTVE